MKILDKKNIYSSSSIFDEETVVLEFTREGIYTGEYPIPSKYEHSVGFKERVDNLQEIPDEIEELWIDNYPALEPYLDEKDVLPNGIVFKLIDGEKSLEECIDLKEFLRKYIFTNNILNTTP